MQPLKILLIFICELRSLNYAIMFGMARSSQFLMDKNIGQDLILQCLGLHSMLYLTLHRSKMGCPCRFMLTLNISSSINGAAITEILSSKGSLAELQKPLMV